MTKFYFRGGSNNLFFALVGLFKFSWHDTYLINEEVKKNAKKITIKWITCLGSLVGKIPTGAFILIRQLSGFTTLLMS